jgi:hypothetical protein
MASAAARLLRTYAIQVETLRPADSGLFSENESIRGKGRGAN